MVVPIYPSAFQALLRGGMVYVRVGRERTYLAGYAVTAFRGELSSWR